ncbi:MAG: carboxy-terminal-processing protease, carboxyl-terminal processing protease [Candidatus Parcubacteria bacterium]|jgi:carboxyl-terminal processing protease
MKKSKVLYFKSFVISSTLFVCGVFVGQLFVPAAQHVYAVKNVAPDFQTGDTDFGPFWKAWKLLQDNYEDTSKGVIATSTATTTVSVTEQDRVWGAIKGLTASYGDPYTTFFDPSETKSFNDVVRGEFDGVGMEVTIKNGILTVVAPLKNTPAEKAGLKPGDKIVKIDAQSTENLSIEKAITLIKGKKGTVVELTIIREGEKNTRVFKVTRDRIVSPVIETKIVKGVYVITIYTFAENSPKLFQDAIEKFKKSGSKKLIIDVRNNPGGYLEAAVSITSWFLPEGTPIVRETRKNTEEKVYRSYGYNIFPKDFKFVVLINGGSASASEILAGALSEQGKATLVGEKTFGKGTVQQLIPVTEDTSIKITIAKWLTPNGFSITHNGINPAVEVKLSKEDVDAKRDPQLDKAIQILNAKK